MKFNYRIVLFDNLNQYEEKRILIEIKSFNAKNGDSFYLYFPNEKFNLLIDGGYNSTYKDEIKLELEKIKSRGENLDLLVITHMDSDHINGIIKLIEENGTNEESNVIKINEIWFNSYFNSPTKKNKINISSEMIKKLKIEIRPRYGEDYVGDIGIRELKKLTNLLINGKYLINTAFNFNAIYTENRNEVKIGKIIFKILSPREKNLKDLDVEFNKKINFLECQPEFRYEEILNDYYEDFLNIIEDSSKILEKKEISFETDLNKLAELEDEEKNTLNNQASIAFVVEYSEKKLVFLGDSSLSIYSEELEKIYKNIEEINFNFIKLSHHGSKFNISSKFISKINCLNYFISTDGSGSHEHPNKETIAKLIVNSKKEIKILLNTTNKSHYRWLDALKNNKFLKEKFNYEIETSNFIKI